jgi:omega-6 fatty acid desaturase (delta-12 desaturase)
MGDSADLVASAALEWRRSLPPERRTRSVRRGVFYFARSGAIYLALFAGASLAPMWWMRLLCFVALSSVIGALFVIAHDAAHQSLTPSRRLNRVLGRLAMLPAWHPYTSWCHAHNTLHHGGTCLKGRHPDFTPLTKAEFDRLPSWRRRVERIYRSPAGVGAAYVFDFYRRYLLFPVRGNQPIQLLRFHLDRLLVLAFLALQLWAAYALAGNIDTSPLPRSVHAVLAIALPWTLWIYFMGVASFVQHTHPRTVWYDDPEEWRFYHVQLASTTHMVLPRPLGAMLHHIMDHPAHHIDPTIPLYELPDSQAQLEQTSPEHSIVEPLTLAEFLRICRVCKLYDYRHHCWLDFDGRPTTEPDRQHAAATAPA